MKIFMCVLLAAVSCTAFGQGTYPTKPVRLVVPFPPGGGVDATGRVLGTRLTAAWRQQLIIDNRSGAGTTIGTEIAAKAAADGYTLLLTNNALAISAGLYSRLRYDTSRDLQPVTEVLRQPFVLVVPVNGFKTVREMIAAAQAKPGTVALANTGIGSGPHLAGVLLGSMTRVQFNYIPYKGGGPAIQDLIGSRVQALLTTPLAAMPHVHGGRLRALGVTSGKRSPALADLPTLAESGVPGYDVSTWYMLLAPAGTPRTIIETVHAATLAALRQPDAAKILASDGAELVLGTPAEATALLKSELKRWAATIKEANVRPED